METLFTSNRWRWLARTLAIAEFLLWGAFFIEHLGWFSDPGRASPSNAGWWQQLAHLTLLIGYLLMWKWEKSGAVVILIGSLTFFSFIGGSNAWWFGLMAISPVVFLFLAWRGESNGSI